jgi:hypothetical protein
MQLADGDREPACAVLPRVFGLLEGEASCPGRPAVRQGRRQPQPVTASVLVPLLAEQFVAQELMVTQRRELHYWSREARGSQAEVDYLVVRNGRIHPVEVKAGAGGQLRSLHLALQTYPTCGDGLVLYGGSYGCRPDARLRFIPLYYAGSESLADA